MKDEEATHCLRQPQYTEYMDAREIAKVLMCMPVLVIFSAAAESKQPDSSGDCLGTSSTQAASWLTGNATVLVVMHNPSTAYYLYSWYKPSSSWHYPPDTPVAVNPSESVREPSLVAPTRDAEI
jgi:hypothetical protein